MDSTSVADLSTEVRSSRLPAGSTLTLPNGVTVPHPHAEANLAGGGDGRASSEAVNEQAEEFFKGGVPDDESAKNFVTYAEVLQRPLSDEVKAKMITGYR